ncbi:MBL fold metallo-hydrolase [Haloglomus litoreum]|uniref:MBL fold metallo-hydrolase n=1 Tax=Haloglomus litoreum TaxID=3034026 RepID=UPI0023E8DD3E|nr:MBL fold metallo-hydrolase [Haloglomus sp. DT116]
MEFQRFEFPQPTWGPSVNVLRIGDTLVDTGHVRSADALREALADPDRLGGVERVVLTHPHIDHVGGTQVVGELADLPHVAIEGVPFIVHDYREYLLEARADMTRLCAGLGATEAMWDDYFPVDREYHEDRIEFERVLQDGGTVRLGSYELDVVSTPGHSGQHAAFWHEPSGTCLPGDIVSENGHFMYAPLHCDIGEYKESLRRLRALEADRLVPMHGPPMEHPQERIEDCLRKAERTESRLLDWLDERDSFFAREFASEVLGAEGAAVGFLSMVAYEYARHLETRGECSVEVTAEGIAVSG